MYTYICENDREKFEYCRSNGYTDIELLIDINGTIDIQNTFQLVEAYGLHIHKIRPVIVGQSLSITKLLFDYQSTVRFYKICDLVNAFACEYGRVIGIVLQCDFTRTVTDVGVIYAALMNTLINAMRGKINISFVFENTTKNLWNTYIIKTLNVLLPREVCEASVAITDYDSANKLLGILDSANEVSNVWVCTKSVKAKSILRIIECASLVDNITFFPRSDQYEYF